MKHHPRSGSASCHETVSFGGECRGARLVGRWRITLVAPPTFESGMRASFDLGEQNIPCLISLITKTQLSLSKCSPCHCCFCYCCWCYCCCSLTWWQNVAAGCCQARNKNLTGHGKFRFLSRNIKSDQKLVLYSKRKFLYMKLASFLFWAKKEIGQNHQKNRFMFAKLDSTEYKISAALHFPTPMAWSTLWHYSYDVSRVINEQIICEHSLYPCFSSSNS